MPQKQTLLTSNTQYLNDADIDHFYNIHEWLYRKLQYYKMHVQAVRLFVFVGFFLEANNGEWQKHHVITHLYSAELKSYSFVLNCWGGEGSNCKFLEKKTR